MKPIHRAIRRPDRPGSIRSQAPRHAAPPTCSAGRLLRPPGTADGEIDSLADRLNISFIGVLTIVAYQFVLIDHMPRMSYLTLCDTALLVSFLMMAATVPQSLLIHTLVRKGKQRIARRIDRTSRWAFPLAYVLLLTGIAYRHGVL